jgi:ubiquinol-cytochrome c reductase cytochrome b subunit
VLALSFWMVLNIAWADDIMAVAFHLDVQTMVLLLRLALVVVPPLCAALSYWMCLGLAEHDREVLEEGLETGLIRQLPNGEYVETHQPLGPSDEQGDGVLDYAGAPVPKRMNQIVPRVKAGADD